jgi:signal transduction histidine kinase
MSWARRVWQEYLTLIELPVIHEVTKPAVLLTVLVFASAPSLIMGYVPAAQRATGYRSPLVTVALLATALGFSWLLHRATAEPPAPRWRIGVLNLLDTGFLATALVAMAASADHPADCVLVVALIAASVAWAMQPGFSWPMLVPAAIWPAGLMAAISGAHVLRSVVASWTVPVYVVVGLLVLRQTRAKREAADLARRQLAESARLATLGQVAASLAHEMSQPLGAIGGHAERLSRGRASGSGEELEAIALASSQLSRLVGQIGLLGAPQPAEPEPLDPSRPVEDALLLLRAQLAHRGIELIWVPPDAPLPQVLADRQRLGQVMVNLLVNARDALEGVAGGAPRWIRIDLEAAGGRVSLAVTDSGPGVPPEVERSMFDPFFTTKERGRGGGLGLAIAREIAEQHGGALAFERPPDGGSRFTLTLPVRPAAA